MERKTVRTAALTDHLFELLRLVKCELAKEELGVPTWLHLETLRFVAERGSPSMRELADYLRVAAPTATAFITALTKDGLIVRKSDPSDRRRVTLALTKKGKSCLKDAATKRARAFERVIAPLSVRERAAFAHILDIIIHTA